MGLDLDSHAGGLESAGVRVEPEQDEGIGILIGGDQPLAGGVDGEVAWRIWSEKMAKKRNHG
jgi:hypothetical protein